MYYNEKKKPIEYSQYRGDSDSRGLLAMRCGGYYDFVIAKINNIIKESSNQIQDNPNSDNPEIGQQGIVSNQNIALSIRNLENRKQLMEEIVARYHAITSILEQKNKSIKSGLQQELVKIINTDQSKSTPEYLSLVQCIADGRHTDIQNLAQAGQQMYEIYQKAHEAILKKHNEANALLQQITTMIAQKELLS